MLKYACMVRVQPSRLNKQSGDCWNWKDNSDLKSEARNVHMGSSPISPIGECNYEETETIIKVATAVQLRQPAGEAQLVEHRTFNPGAASSKLVARIMRLWCIGCTTALQAVGSGSTPDRRFIYRSVAESIRNALKMRRPKGIVGSCPTRSTNGMWSNW